MATPAPTLIPMTFHLTPEQHHQVRDILDLIHTDQKITDPGEQLVFACSHYLRLTLREMAKTHHTIKHQIQDTRSQLRAVSKKKASRS